MKKKNIRLFLTFIFVFFCLIMPTYATSKYLALLDPVNIRKGPGTNYSIIKLGTVGTTYYLKSEDLIEDEPKDGTCDAGWYEIDYNGESGYVCSDYVQVYTPGGSETGTPTTTCEKEMQAAGFPSSYWTGLCSLKEKHPNWTFKAIETNLEWTSVIEKQSACGKSLIQTNNSEYLDSSCKAYDGSFKAASQKAVAFYMDPRNFFTERYVFQFEYLKYDNDLKKEYAPGITKLFENAEFYKYHKKQGNNLPKLVAQAGKETDVSPIFLGSRIYQELGATAKLINLYGGTYIKDKPRVGETKDKWDPKEYYGYYNFYNIGVTSSCNNQYGSTYCGLSTAKRNNWNGLYEAIKGGASFLSGGYINVGQYTGYLQKYNVAPTDNNKLHTHQYMTNVMAPSSESTITYNSYNKLGLLNSSFAFYIPVYKNMNASINNMPSGGSGEPSESSASSPSETDVGTIVTSAGYKSSGDYLTGITIGSSVDDMKDKLESIAGTGNVNITNAKGGNAKGKIGTGFKVKVTNKDGSKTYTIVVKGDTSGDGKINALDLLQIQKNILKVKDLKDAYKLAGDTSGDGKINALDLLQVQKNILGVKKIK